MGRLNVIVFLRCLLLRRSVQQRISVLLSLWGMGLMVVCLLFLFYCYWCYVVVCYGLVIGFYLLVLLFFVLLLVKWFLVELSCIFCKVCNVLVQVIIQFFEMMIGIEVVQVYYCELCNQEIFIQLVDWCCGISVWVMWFFVIFMLGIILIGNIIVGFMLFIGGYFVLCR